MAAAVQLQLNSVLKLSVELDPRTIYGGCMLFPIIIFFFWFITIIFVSSMDTQNSRANTSVYPNIKLIHNNTATTVVYTIEYISILLQVTTGNM